MLSGRKKYRGNMTRQARPVASRHVASSHCNAGKSSPVASRRVASSHVTAGAGKKKGETMKKKRQRSITNPRIIAELKALAKKSEGVLTADAVVKAARAKKSALHNSFEWSDTRAAHQYRLFQARQMLRVVVEFMPSIEKNVRVFVSLTPDRDEACGGYRVTADVLQQSDQRAQLLADALAELAYFQKKYAMLKELAGVWREVAKLM
jgi:Skp family chaperone for outer membrane proteins